MALFLSTIINKMDAKGRVSVPSTYRNSLQKQSFKGVIAFPSYNHHSIDACGIDRMEKISNNLDEDNQYSKEEFDVISLYFGEAEQLPFDKEGRIILPKKLVDHAKIDKDVLFVGLGPFSSMASYFCRSAIGSSSSKSLFGVFFGGDSSVQVSCHIVKLLLCLIFSV